MFYKIQIGVVPRDGCDLPPPGAIAGDLTDVLAEHLNGDAAYDFTVVTMAIDHEGTEEPS